MQFRRRLPLSFVLAGVLAAGANPARAAEVDKYLPADSEVIFVINVQQILDSPLIKKHALGPIREMLKGNAEAQRVFTALGFDPLRDVTSLTAVMPGISPNEKGLLILHGRFDTAKFHAQAEETAKNKADILKIHKEGTEKVFEVKPPGQDSPLFVGLVDGTTVVASPGRDYVLRAFATRAGKKDGTVKKEVQALIQKTDAKQSFWLAVPGSTLGKSEFASDERAKKTLAKVEAFTLGATLADDIQAHVTITAKNAEGAKDLAQELKEGLEQAKGLVTILAGSQKELAPVVDLLGAIKMSTEGNMVVLRAGMSAEALEKSLRRGQ
jgi:hypothetical protein